MINKLHNCYKNKLNFLCCYVFKILSLFKNLVFITLYLINTKIIQILDFFFQIKDRT